MSGHFPLPELIRIDLNKDSSVTLMLTHPSYEIGVISFGAGNTERPFKLTELGATFPEGGELERLTFNLVDRQGQLFVLKAATQDALTKLGQIHEHLKQVQPKPDAAVIPYVLQQAAFYLS